MRIETKHNSRGNEEFIEDREYGYRQCPEDSGKKSKSHLCLRSEVFIEDGGVLYVSPQASRIWSKRG